MEYFTQQGITSDSSLKEIKKAYNKLIMKYHPDRKTGDKTIFTEIESANEELLLLKTQNKEKKDRQAEMFAKIESFKASYQHSEEEKNDIKNFYIQFKGNIPKIIQNLFCASYSDDNRIRKVIDEMIVDGKLEKGKYHSKRISNKKLKREEKEALEVERDLIKEKTDKKNISLK